MTLAMGLVLVPIVIEKQQKKRKHVNFGSQTSVYVAITDWSLAYTQIVSLQGLSHFIKFPPDLLHMKLSSSLRQCKDFVTEMLKQL